MDNLESCAAEKSNSSEVETVSPQCSSGKETEKKQNGASTNKNVKKSPSKNNAPEGTNIEKQLKSPKGGNKLTPSTLKPGTPETVEKSLAMMSLEEVPSPVGQPPMDSDSGGSLVLEEASPKVTRPINEAAKSTTAPSHSIPLVGSSPVGSNLSSLKPPAPALAAQPSTVGGPQVSCCRTAKPISVGKPSDKNTKRIREDKIRKKDDKSVDQVVKVLGSLMNTEQKLGAMCQKYSELVSEHRLLQNAAKLCEKKNSILLREKEQLQADHSKAILTRSRLENLCRELQRQNKAVKEECLQRMREEEEKKREVANKFQSTLTELGTVLAENNDKNIKLRDDNIDMSNKLRTICEQYERKEENIEKLAKKMNLEMQLAEAKLAKSKMEMAMEKETLLREKQQLLMELSQYQTQLEEMKLSETALRNQIQLYNDKYDEFHKALLQSNEAIGGFKQEMERMSKQIRKLEKETVSWKSRYEAAHRTLLQMTEEKMKSDQNASAANRKLVALQGLCRGLQAQCTGLRNELKGVTPTVPVRTDQEEELMSQVEKELNETAAEDDVNSDNSPCPRQLSRESAEKVNGEAVCLDDPPPYKDVVPSLVEPLSPPDPPLTATSAPADDVVKDNSLPPAAPEGKCSSAELVIQSSPNGVVNPNGDVCCDHADIKHASNPQQNKKNKAKKKNKK